MFQNDPILQETICKKAGWKKEWAWTSYSPFLPFFCSKFIHLPSFNPEFSSFSARWWREPNQNQRLVVSIWMLREKHRRSNGLKPDFPAECHKTLGYNLKFLTQTYFISFPVCKSSQLILHGSTKIFHPVSLVQSSLFLRCSRFCPTNSPCFWANYSNSLACFIRPYSRRLRRLTRTNHHHGHSSEAAVAVACHWMWLRLQP